MSSVWHVCLLTMRHFIAPNFQVFELNSQFKRFPFLSKKIYIFNINNNKSFFSILNFIIKIYESCYWERILTNKTYVYNPNATQQEQFMICETLGVLNTSLEYQQFYTMNIWALRFAMVTWAKSQTFTDFLNKIIQNARSFRSKNQYYALALVLSRQNIISVCQRRNIILGVLTNSSNITLNLINSPWLKIDVQRLAFLSANDSKVVEISKIGWLNFTFYVNGLSQSAVSLNINMNSLSSIKNG